MRALSFLIISALAMASLSPPALAQQSVVGVPLVGTGAGLDTATANAQTGGVVVTGPTSFYGVTITLTTGQGPGWLLFFDATTVPPDGVVSPVRCIYVDAGPRTSVFGSSGFPLSMLNGMAWTFSTGANCQTKVASTANFVGVSYKQQRR